MGQGTASRPCLDTFAEIHVAQDIELLASSLFRLAGDICLPGLACLSLSTRGMQAYEVVRGLLSEAFSPRATFFGSFP